MSFTTATPEIVCKFSMGDSSASDEEDEETSCDVGIQTDSKMSHFKTLQRLPSKQQPRSLTECVQILNSDVSRCLVSKC